MDGNKNILGGVRAFSPLLQAYEAGYSKEEIKAGILESLEPEFENPEILDRYGIDLWAVESVNVTKVRINGWSSDLYDKSIEVRRSLLASNKNTCAEICSQWEEQIGKALTFYWNAVRFEHHKGNLPIDEYAYELFRNIGALIEGTLQVYLKELLHIASCAQGESTSYSEVSSLSLGNVVNKLSEKLGDSDIFTLNPWGVPLNQWRNIAQHFSIDTKDSTITCTYGAKNQHFIRLERKELMEVARSVFTLYSAIRTSQTIFFLDNADSLISHCKGSKRKDVDEQFQFCVGAASQGFEVIDLKVSDEKAYAQFSDATDEDSLERALHASQFVYQLWEVTRSSVVVIKYDTKSGKKSLVTTAKSEDCEKVYSGEESFAYLSKVVDFETEQKT
ncbi:MULTISPECIES: hypothetical protein [unclassified Halomonas]|uniref:hypothetical protein n=1 Tax=unclassified Halomonas TaxID=2609666 RepID=UPI0007D8E6CF|nr:MULTISPECIES: hypothetical protein [unclassified Halomonas]MBT2786506.1 hypothetical protein [Halomonas sp. ISL-106]MBT2797528.1 hypothetical protein [Halomonas sp. ISL-104]OAL58882.1 hypothetical protein A6R74_08375 [Halomonas sp. ALS9]